MSSFMRFFRGANGAEEQQQQPPQQQQGRSAQSSSQQQQRPSSSSSSSRRGGGPASPPKAKAGAGQQQQQHHHHQQHNNKRAHGHGQKPKAAAAAEGPSPSRGGKAAKTGDGTMSPMSAMALNQLQGYSDQLDGLEDEVRAIEAALRDRRTPRARLLEAKDAVAQLNGSLEKGIDSVLCAELGEGKELAKETRKSLNRRCDALRDRILQAREGLGRILATSP